MADLVAKPPQVYSYWRVSPLEFIIWCAAVLVTVFSTIEDGIYTSICVSLALLLVRLARPRGYFLGRVSLTEQGSSADSRDVFVPIKKNGVLNPYVKVNPPEPGVIVYRFEEVSVSINAALSLKLSISLYSELPLPELLGYE